MIIREINLYLCEVQVAKGRSRIGGSWDIHHRDRGHRDSSRDPRTYGEGCDITAVATSWTGSPSRAILVRSSPSSGKINERVMIEPKMLTLAEVLSKDQTRERLEEQPTQMVARVKDDH